MKESPLINMVGESRIAEGKTVGKTDSSRIYLMKILLFTTSFGESS